MAMPLPEIMRCVTFFVVLCFNDNCAVVAQQQVESVVYSSFIVIKCCLTVVSSDAEGN